MKFLLFIAILLAAFTTERSLSNPAGLTCTLTSDKAVYNVGELPIFKVEIHNNSKDDIYLIGSLDGSDVKWRFPYCYFSIERPEPETIRSVRCGNMNTLRVADFKLVKAGEKFDPYEIIDNYGFFSDHTTTNEATFKNPGTYKLKFHYSTNSQNIADFIGDRTFGRNQMDSITIAELFNKVPRIEITSNEIEILIEE